MNKLTKISIAIFIICIFVITIYYIISTIQLRSKISSVLDFKTCVEQNFPVQESYPRICKTPDGSSYIEDIEVNCQYYGLNECPLSCGVCPPCEVCSSLSCQDKDTCISNGFDEEWQKQIRTPNNDVQSSASLANPASINCENKGGTLDMRNDTEGNQTGYCVFPDGHECEEWALDRGKCQ